MFIHIGKNTVIKSRDVIAILDSSTAKSAATSEFLQIAKEEGFVKSEEKEGKSIIITEKNIYFSPISSITLLKRANILFDLNDYIV
ncbi:extracellular matrix regulator RemB [Thermovenabulum gondwanense]|uniref:DUF370 domain-containing protein n=1 Tax=Thermovenabulum gondwanense TaxID=520767 RepID=A0A162MSU5_9FIRM|nr:extracellular matrix/biofilm biosynthesis regulator RemA family protein [Thermovenabulum gondwanense]KYO67252.1 hypothetical protein ATZ99_05380 [Thermovenabulum gondwanense]